ncbi:MAG: glycosyl transferase family 28, partial [Phaeodactylibacter sp.]|nr:glycosyl transferase family 28 [Phaeodactylibacter sp.]
MSARPRILVAPLDWGLGHATRCVPVIRELQRQGAEPVLATAGRAAAYLQAEFPGLELIEFPAYDIRYP